MLLKYSCKKTIKLHYSRDLRYGSLWCHRHCPKICLIIALKFASSKGYDFVFCLKV